ncbi:MAG: hypothetical protein ABNH00_12785 [Dokdonia sp.]|jgi:hypothetical protein
MKKTDQTLFYADGAKQQPALYEAYCDASIETGSNSNSFNDKLWQKKSNSKSCFSKGDTIKM